MIPIPGKVPKVIQKFNKAFGLPKKSIILWQNFNKVISNSEGIDRNAGLISDNGVQVANNAADAS